MYAQRHTIAIETDEAGAAVGYSPAGLTGRIHMIGYRKDGTTPFADTVDWAIVLEATGESLWTDTNITASEKVYPVAAANLGGTGAASSLTEAPIIAANDRVKITISNGGDTKLGAFDLVVT